MKNYILLIVTVCAISLSSCAHLNQTCATALPLLSQGNALINDAQDALMQASIAVAAIQDDNVRDRAESAIAEARSGLRVAESMLHSASEACTSPDLPTIFRAFASAWDIVRSYLSTHGGLGGPTVADPKAYLLTR